MDTWELLQRKHMVAVLLAIHRNPGLTQLELIDGEGRNTKFKRLGELCDEGLVIAKLSSKPRRNTVIYYTTDEGETLAENLANLLDGKKINEKNHGSSAAERTSVKN